MRWSTLWMMIASITGSLAAWQWVASAGWVPAALFPPPTRVAAAFRELAASGELVRDLKSSLWRAVAGFAVGMVAGTVLGLATGRVRLLDGLLSPPLQVMRALPPVATLALWIIWVGIEDRGKVIAIGFAVFFTAWISAHTGAREVPRSFLWSARSMGCGPIASLFRVVLPAAGPFVLAGARSAAALSFVMVYVSELAGTSSTEGGLGYQIATSQLAYRVDRMMAALLTLGLCGAAFDFLIVRAAWLAFPWLKLTHVR